MKRDRYGRDRFPIPIPAPLAHVLTGLCLLLTFHAGDGRGQALGVQYVWQDSATVGVTGADSLFSTVWETVNIFCDGGNGWIKIGAPDTSNWGLRHWTHLKENQVVTLEPSTKLRRIKFKAETGKVTFYFVGTKRKPKW